MKMTTKVTKSRILRRSTVEEALFRKTANFLNIEIKN